jgi:hypothetical protein
VLRNVYSLVSIFAHIYGSLLRPYSIVVFSNKICISRRVTNVYERISNMLNIEYGLLCLL